MEQRTKRIAGQIGPTPIREEKYEFSTTGLSGMKGEQYIDVGHPCFTIRLTFEPNPEINPTETQVEEDEVLEEFNGYTSGEVSEFQNTGLVSSNPMRTTSPSAVEYLSDRGLLEIFDTAVGAAQEAVLSGTSGSERRTLEEFTELESVTVALLHDRTIVLANRSNMVLLA